MISISVCVGSACHLKGSYRVIELLKQFIEANKLSNVVELKGAFCLGHCTEGVSVKINDEEKVYSLNENVIEQFMKEEIYRRIKP